ncbi:MAG: DoxX family protein [Saprospiraceae bacterium]
MATRAKQSFPPIAQDTLWLIFRVSIGAFMITHGVGKLLKLFGDEPIKFMDFMGIGPTASLALVVFAEFFCAILLILGLFTRIAAAMIAITMAVASFYALSDDPFSDRETPLLYLVACLAIIAIGAGNWSVDRLIRGKS